MPPLTHPKKSLRPSCRRSHIPRNLWDHHATAHTSQRIYLSAAGVGQMLRTAKWTDCMTDPCTLHANTPQCIKQGGADAAHGYVLVNALPGQVMPKPTPPPAKDEQGVCTCVGVCVGVRARLARSCPSPPLLLQKT
eukprot:507632-Pelagomonas_calceolata.AAC.1